MHKSWEIVLMEENSYQLGHNETDLFSVMFLIGRKCRNLRVMCTNLQHYPEFRFFHIFHKSFSDTPLRSLPKSPPMSSPLLIKPILQLLMFRINKAWCWLHNSCQTELFPVSFCCKCQPWQQLIALACFCRMYRRAAILDGMCFKFLTRPGQLVTFHNQTNLSAKNWLY